MRSPVRVVSPALLALSTLLIACGGSASTPSAAPSGGAAPSIDGPWPEAVIGEPLGTVGGVPIGSKEFDQLALRRVGPRGELTDEVRDEVMEQLVKEKLLYAEALRRGIGRDPKIQKMMVNTLLKEEVYSEVRTGDIVEDELRAYFEEHKDEFVVPEKVQVKRILLKAEAGEDDAAVRSRADALLAELKDKPEDFRALAQKNSRGPYARRGGDLGFITEQGKPGVPELVVTEAFALQKGGMSAPFRTEDGWNIVYVPNRRPRVERTFEQMKGSVMRKVKSDRYKALYDDYVTRLRAGAAVELNEAKIRSHQVSVPERGPSDGHLELPEDSELPGDEE